MTIVFMNSWLWLIFIIIGLLLVVTELIVGVDTGLDLVFIGSAFVLGGLITWAFHSWIATALLTSFLAILYVILGRSKVRHWINRQSIATNVDSVIGQSGVVTIAVPAGSHGYVKIHGEEWRATSSDSLPVGSEVQVLSVSGVTVTVKKK